MKKILILVLMLFAFYCYAECAETNTSKQTPKVSKKTKQAPKESRIQALTRMCENEGNEEACQTLYVEARVGCNDYDAIACSNLGYMHTDNKYNFYVKNISQKELLKNKIIYVVKACMLGSQEDCKILERWKISLENYSRNNP